MTHESELRDHATEFLDPEEATELEDTLWWYVGRRAILADFLNRAQQEGSTQRILEIGCGSGGDLATLAAYGPVTGLERSPILASRARAREVAEAIHERDFSDLDTPERFRSVLPLRRARARRRRPGLHPAACSALASGRAAVADGTGLPVPFRAA